MKKQLGLAYQAGRRIQQMKIGVYAANACYFLILSLFPMLLLILSSLRFTSLSAQDLIELVETILPHALYEPAESFIVSTYYASSGAMVSFSAVAALWSASRGMYSLLTGLNHIYGVQENRGYLYTRLLSVLYLFVMLIVVVATLILQVFGESLLGWLMDLHIPMVDWLHNIVDLRFLVLLCLQTVVFTGMYTMLPNRRNGFWESLPGAVVAAVGWQTCSNVFSIYVEHFSGYMNIYGSVYLIALGMLWLYWCISVVLLGAGLNRLIQQGLGK